VAKRARGGTGGTGRTKWIVPLIAVLLVAGAAAYGISRRGGGGTAMATQPIAVTSDPAEFRRLAVGVTSGDPNAPITIMEFADYSCPHCREFEEQLKPRIDMTYIQPGKAKFVFYDFVLGGFPHSFLAARAARCAGDQQKYMEYHDVLFREQATWSTSRSAPVAQLLDYADEIGLDREAFEACLRSDRFADVVSANRELAQQLNLTGTPKVLIFAGGPSLPQLVDDPDMWGGIVRRMDALLGVDSTAAAAPTP
jgi:protein-disulfide isomerase